MPDLINTAQAALMLGLSPSTLAVWRTTGQCGLPFIRIGRKVRYSKRGLERWLTQRTNTGNAAQ